jgi:predicted permease
LSLGASRGRVVRQLFTESLVLGLAAAALALLISRAVIDSALYFLFTTIPAEFGELFRAEGLALPTDLRVAGFLVIAAVIAAVLFGFVPALKVTRPAFAPGSRALRRGRPAGAPGSSARSGEAGRDVRPSRARNALIVVQVTASALLLISAGIFLRGAHRARRVDPGFRVNDILIVDNPADERSRPAMLSVLDTTDAVVSAFAAVWPGGPTLNRPKLASVSAAGADSSSPAEYRFVSAEYFDVLDIPVLKGRVFTKEEAASRAPVAVVSETVARRVWPDGNAVGQVLRMVADPEPRPSADDRPLSSPSVVVLGVVRDVRGFSPQGDGSEHTGIYVPTIATDARTTIIVRVQGDPELARRTLTDRLASVDPNIGMILTMRTLAALRTYPLQAAFWVIVVLGGLALVLTLSGIYGVLSYLVVQRTKEIGVRIALGATTGAVTRLVLGQSLRLVALGITVGVFLAWTVSAILASRLPVSGPFAGVIHLFDGVAYAGSLLTIVAACVVAASVPALRAARIDPIVTLRHD